jgi:ABC-type multidrug transport system ATPase subunit
MRRRVCRAEPALFPLMTVHDHIALASTARGVDRRAGLERAARLGLSEWLGENAGNLSTGSAKKLWYLINTIGDYDLAVLDEPFNGVDAESIEVIANELTHLAQHGTVVLIAHALTADVVPDRVIDVRELTGGL